MKLYMHPVSMTSRPVRLFAAESKIAMDEQTIDLFAGEHMQPTYAGINPNCLVPMLEDDDLKLTESSAILKYLADKVGSPAYPKDLKKRAKVNEMLDWINTNFYREWGYNLCYPQMFPHLKRRSAGGDPGIGQGERQALAEGAERSLDWAEQQLSVREGDYDRRLFRRLPGDAWRGDRRRFFALSECDAMGRHHEKAAKLAQGERGVQRARVVSERPEVRHAVIGLSCRRALPE